MFLIHFLFSEIPEWVLLFQFLFSGNVSQSFLSYFFVVHRAHPEKTLLTISATDKRLRVKTHTGLIICRFSWSRDSTYVFNCSNPAAFFLGKQILILTRKNRLSHNYELETAGFSTNHSFALFPVRSQQQAILQTTLHSFTMKRKQDFDISNTLEHQKLLFEGRSLTAVAWKRRDSHVASESVQVVVGLFTFDDAVVF